MITEDEVTLEAQFRQALREHDWYYERSDDHRVWTKGNGEHDRLLGLCERLQPMIGYKAIKKIWEARAPTGFRYPFREKR